MYSPTYIYIYINKHIRIVRNTPKTQMKLQSKNQRCDKQRNHLFCSFPFCVSLGHHWAPFLFFHVGKYSMVDPRQQRDRMSRTDPNDHASKSLPASLKKESTTGGSKSPSIPIKSAAPQRGDQIVRALKQSGPKVLDALWRMGMPQKFSSVSENEQAIMVSFHKFRGMATSAEEGLDVVQTADGVVNVSL